MMVMTLKKILILTFFLCAVMAFCMPPASADFLSINLTEPSTVVPGEIFRIDILVTNMAPVVLDHCNFWLSIDPWADLVMIPWGGIDPCQHLHFFFDTLAYPPPYGSSGYFGTILAKVCDDAPIGTFLTTEVYFQIIADLVTPDGEIWPGGWGQEVTAFGITEVVAPSDPVPAPEFPSPFLPATMIIGLSGVVLLIQRTREL